MREPPDAVLPILKKIQEDLSTGFKRVDAKLNNVAEAVAEMSDGVTKIHKDNPIHLGLTAGDRIDLEELGEEVKSLKVRLAVWESRS